MDASKRYHNLKYAIYTLCDVIESANEEKGEVDKSLLDKLDLLTDEMKELKKEIQKEKKENHGDRWKKKILSLRADAILDETISEDMQERIVSCLEEIAEMVCMHEDNL